jgi:RNA polymerase sigma-70 factor (ECF subfamily)
MTVVDFRPEQEEQRLVLALKAGDEQAFAELLERHHGALVRLANTFVRDRAVAEEVVQETWLAVIKGLGNFRGESSLKTWIFRILTNRAKTRAVRERRTVPFSALEADIDEPNVDPDRFLDPSHPQWPGHWASPPANWRALPEERLLAGETRELIQSVIAELPPPQQRVITLRDVEGWDSNEVCELLRVSEGNQRVLLHRARSKVRAALEVHFAPAQ